MPPGQAERPESLVYRFAKVFIKCNPSFTDVYLGQDKHTTVYVSFLFFYLV